MDGIAQPGTIILRLTPNELQYMRDREDFDVVEAWLRASARQPHARAAWLRLIEVTGACAAPISVRGRDRFDR